MEILTNNIQTDKVPGAIEEFVKLLKMGCPLVTLQIYLEQQGSKMEKPPEINSIELSALVNAHEHTICFDPQTGEVIESTRLLP